MRNIWPNSNVYCNESKLKISVSWSLNWSIWTSISRYDTHKRSCETKCADFKTGKILTLSHWVAAGRKLYLAESFPVWTRMMPLSELNFHADRKSSFLHCRKQFIITYSIEWQWLRWEKDKVITTMVTRPLDDRTYCTRSGFTYLGLWRKLYDYSFIASLHNQSMRSQLCSIDIDLQPVGCNLKLGDFLTPIYI